MDDDVLDDHRHTDAESFGEWIEQVAESRDVSEDELLHQLMSSYWMMDELATVIDDLEIEAGRSVSDIGSVPEGRSDTGEAVEKSDGSDGKGEAESDSDRDEQSEGAGFGDYEDGVIPLIETLKDWKSEREQPESSTVDENLIDLIKVIQEGNQAASASRPEPEGRYPDSANTGASSVNETVELIRALKEFSEPSGGSSVQERLATEQGRVELTDRIEELEAEVQATSEDVKQIDQSTQQRTRKLAKELQQLDSRLDSIDKALQNKPDRETVEKIEDGLNEVADDVTSVRSEVDSQFDEVESEFENVEQLLTHLFDQVDENSSKTESLADQVSTIQTRVAALDDLEAAMDLQREANRAGISSATCESCEEAVEIGQLTEPECPFCSAEFAELTEEKKWGIFRHHVLSAANSGQEG